ncbi:MAG: gliding motility-associated C-terminal domain-containing protein, partial [Flavobacteriales bacterium]
TELTPPSVDLGPDQVVCPGTSATFDATTAGATYLWSDGSTAPTLITDQPGNYSVQVAVNGCTASDAVTLSYFNLQTVDLGPDRTICAGESTILGVHVPGASYLWNTGATTDSVSISVAGTYWVEASVGGCAARDSVEVSVSPLPVVTFSDQQVCPGSTATLDATTAGASYLWSTGATTPSLNVGVGIWSVAVTVNGCTGSGVASITELTPPSVDLGPDTLLCPGEFLVLDAGQTGATYLWSTGASTASITVTSASTATVTVTDAQGCSSSDAITISYANPGTLSLGPDITFCSGSQIILDATMPGATSYLWSNGASNTTLTTSTAGTYWVSISQGQCTLSDTVVLHSVTSPSITLGNDTTLCPGETLQLQVPSAGVQLEWQDGTQADAFLVEDSGNYWVAATNAAGCTDTAFVQVTYLGANAFDLGTDTLLCDGASIQLNAGLPGGSTLWSGSSTASTAILTVNSAGLYIATTTVSGCAFTDSITVSMVPLPTVDLGPNTHFCEGSSLELIANGVALQWDDGSNSPVRTITEEGTYWVQVTENGCSAADTITVTQVPLPLLNLEPDTALCSTEQLFVDVTVPGGSYLWNDGNTDPVRSLPTGIWNVEVMATGCAISDTIRIQELPSPQLALPNDTTLCAGDVWTIDVAQPDASYSWSTGSTSSSLLVNSPGTYGVTVDIEGCVASAQVVVSIVDMDQFSLGPDTMLCPGASLELNVGIPGAVVLWQDGSSAPMRIIDSPGSYQATVTVGSCTAQSAVDIGFTPLPQPDLGADQVLCAGDTVLLSIDPGAAQAIWSTGGTGPELSATASGLYAVELMLDGCISSDAVLLTFHPVVDQLDLGPDQDVCPEYPLLLNATTPGATYAWNNGSHQPTLTVTQPGTYSVSISGTCIQAADTIIIVAGACTPLVHIPNAFTPDGDQINDRFSPTLIEPVRSWTFMIFDRWGELIFSTTDPEDSWDGTFRGKEAPIGVYVWDLHYEAITRGGVVQKQQRGSVTLVR